MEEKIRDVAGTLSMHEHDGPFGVYEEWKPGDLMLDPISKTARGLN